MKKRILLLSFLCVGSSLVYAENRLTPQSDATEDSISLAIKDVNSVDLLKRLKKENPTTDQLEVYLSLAQKKNHDLQTSLTRWQRGRYFGGAASVLGVMTSVGVGAAYGALKFAGSAHSAIKSENFTNNVVALSFAGMAGGVIGGVGSAGAVMVSYAEFNKKLTSLKNQIDKAKTNIQIIDNELKLS